MSTPPNPPSTPAGPPTEPAGTPTAETEPIPAPAPTLSLEKTPAEPADAPTAETEPIPAPAPTLSLEKTPTEPATPEATGTPEAPESPVTPVAPVAPAAATPQPAPAASAFAPPMPAPAAAQTHATPGFGAPGAPGHTWPESAPRFPGAPYPGYPQAAPRSNGLAVAALVTGGFGILLGVIPFLFWAGTLIAAVGVGLGIGAIVRANKGAPNKSMAVVGTVLSVLGLLASVGGFALTVMVVDKADDLDRHAGEEWGADRRRPSTEPWPSKSPSPTQVPGLTSALPFGETFTYPNGVQVSLSVPTMYKPTNSYSREHVKNAVQLTVTITNGSSTPHEVIYAMPNVRDDQGMTAEMVFDGGNVPKMIRGSILPGETATGVVAFEVPKGTRSITADISAGVMLDDVKYAGPIG
ncbi:DUF4190 domain-containing protein [Streptomyces spororaveus]|uniref:DUF4352 domain-containing protein n=1 Tax=Streptomyces spororaveus TaxID=284039 RepID=A0ABQ3TJ53_9ACTN|nr:DUF4190 domain-containing protein [Streptomyces spororaveus]GHI80440.1 hypothetical protein Sspor_60010 [Streptomyces spororaveus]